MFVNKEEILDAVDLYDLCVHLGVDMIVSGNTVKIRCPLHNDRHIGNCSFKQGQKRFYCYSCNKGGDALTLVMAFLGISFSDAIYYLADFSGVKPVSEEKKSIDKRIRVLSTKDAEFLGIKIKPVKMVYDVVDNPVQDCVFNSIFDNKYVRLYTVYSNPLKALYDADFDEYCEIVKNAALEKIKVLTEIRNSKAWGDYKESVYEATRNLIEKATTILLSHGGDIPKEAPLKVKKINVWEYGIPF